MWTPGLSSVRKQVLVKSCPLCYLFFSFVIIFLLWLYWLYIVHLPKFLQ
jgi:hypothetical protein